MQKSNLVYDIRNISDFRDLISSCKDLYGNRPAFILKKDGELVNKSYNDFYDDVKNFAEYLVSQGLENKKIALIGNNCYEWALTYFAVTCGVGVLVPLDRDLKSEEINHLVDDCDASAIIASDSHISRLDKINGTVKIFKFSDISSFIETEKSKKIPSTFYSHKIDRDALAVLLYTSGTTGVSKGVMLSQANICSDIMGVCRGFSISPEDRALSILPLHHTFECTAGFLTIIYSGGSIAYNTSMKTLVNDFKTYRPTILGCVPLVLETFRKEIYRNYRKVAGGAGILKMQKRFANMAPGQDYSNAKRIFKSIHVFFGGNLRKIVCGGAALDPDVYKDFRTFGFTIYNGYGLTETSPVISVQNDFYSSPYDNGRPISGVRVKISDPNEDGSGELLVKGPNVMLGYYNNPEATDQVFDEEHWFKTGDIVKLNDKNAINVVGRCKTMIVTNSGKKIFPEEIEHYFIDNPYVSECMAFGQKQKGDTVVAVSIFPNYDSINEFLKQKDLQPETDEAEAAVKMLFKDQAKNVSDNLPYYKAIRVIIIRKHEFEKTTTRKIKRNEKSNFEEA